VWKLRDENVVEEFHKRFEQRKDNIGPEVDLNNTWSIRKEHLVKTTEELCVSTRGIARHKETW